MASFPFVCDWFVADYRMFARKIPKITIPQQAVATSIVIMRLFIRLRCRSRGKRGNKSLLIGRIIGSNIEQKIKFFHQLFVTIELLLQSPFNRPQLVDLNPRACLMPGAL
jgi:hypothetical protein